MSKPDFKIALMEPDKYCEQCGVKKTVISFDIPPGYPFDPDTGLPMKTYKGTKRECRNERCKVGCAHLGHDFHPLVRRFRAFFIRGECRRCKGEFQLT